MQHKKPVVLHTKGMEKEILECIRLYPNTYHVHWYSCMEYVEEYRDLDCYFSIGPFPSVDKSVQKVCQLVPCDRLLIESDGIDAISWAIHRNIQDDEYLSSLYTIAKQIGDIKKKNRRRNFRNYLSQSTTLFNTENIVKGLFFQQKSLFIYLHQISITLDASFNFSFRNTYIFSLSSVKGIAGKATNVNCRSIENISGSKGCKIPCSI